MTQEAIGWLFLLIYITYVSYELYWLIIFQVALKRNTGDSFECPEHISMMLLTFCVYGVLLSELQIIYKLLLGGGLISLIVLIYLVAKKKYR
ncbi:hypothetical protein RI065_04370 [Mycoplasmatota bacterium zrk1]